MVSRRTFGEFDGIDVLRSYLGAASDGLVLVGIGDDAAVLKRPSADVVVSVDASREGTHFDLSWLSLQQAAARSFHAAASDLAAMGAEPLCAVSALELPQDVDRRVMSSIARGQAKAARQLQCPVVGGNVTRGACVGFTTTVLGTLRGTKAVLRSGARAGDEVWLSHEAGWAGLGLRLFQHGLASLEGRRIEFAPTLGPWKARAVRAWTSPTAKLPESREWRSRVHSLIDTSDSLASEASHLAKASGKRVVLDADRLFATHSGVMRAEKHLGMEPLDAVLYGGEDYALLATGPQKKRPSGALVVGYVEDGQGAVLRSGGKDRPLRHGFDHLRART